MRKAKTPRNQNIAPIHVMNSSLVPWLATAVLGVSLISTTGCKTCGCADMKSGASSHAAVKPYPLTTCIVSGEKLDSMGEPVVFTYQGQEIKLCCKNCRKDFDADPAKYVSKLAAAAPSADAKADHSSHH